MYLMLQHQEIGPVKQDAERSSYPFKGPFAGIACGMYVAAPSKPGPVGAGQHRRPTGPEHESLKCLEALGRDRQTIHRLRKRSVDVRGVGVGRGRDHYPGGGLAPSDLIHPSRYPTAHRRKCQRQQ